MKLRTTLTSIAATVLLGLTGCSTEATPASTTTVDTEPAPAAADGDSLTRETFDLTWSLASETERDAYCMSVAILPSDQAAAEMRAGAGYSDELNWPLMVELMEAECALR